MAMIQSYCPSCLRPFQYGRRKLFSNRNVTDSITISRRMASLARAITPAAPADVGDQPRTTSVKRYKKTQPPSHKPPELRKSQLIRQYVSLLRSTPLLLFLQHSNLSSLEWLSVRRELTIALNKVDEMHGTNYTSDIKIQVVQTRLFDTAMRLVDFYRPEQTLEQKSKSQEQDSQAQIDAGSSRTTTSPEPVMTHVLSSEAHDAVLPFKRNHVFAPLFLGPLATMSFPTIAPAHLKTVIQFLFTDKAAGFPAPTRRQLPGFYDYTVQSGLQKLFLLGARCEGRPIDHVDVLQIGKLQDLGGLRAQVVALLGSVGGQVLTTLDAHSRSLYMTLEGRKSMLEDAEKPKDGSPRTDPPEQSK